MIQVWGKQTAFKFNIEELSAPYVTMIYRRLYW